MGSNGRNGNRAHLEIVPYEADKTAEGFMVFPGIPAAEIEVKRTVENDHLFMYNRSFERFEVLRYGSALIVSMLRMHESAGPARGPKLAVFGTDGNFHNHLLLREPLSPREADSGDPKIKHTVIFDQAVGQKHQPLTMAVDDIYIFSLAKPPVEKPIDDI